MGNFEEEPIDENELYPFLREGIEMRDLVNLKKAFNKFDLPVEEPNGKTILKYQQFMEIMIDNILKNRKKFGNEAISYESETHTVLCLFCPFKQN